MRPPRMATLRRVLHCAAICLFLPWTGFALVPIDLLPSPPICKMSCAGTQDCCCKARWKAKMSSGRREKAPTPTAWPWKDRCPPDCSSMPCTRLSAERVSLDSASESRPAFSKTLPIASAPPLLQNGLDESAPPRGPPTRGSLC